MTAASQPLDLGAVLTVGPSSAELAVSDTCCLDCGDVCMNCDLAAALDRLPPGAVCTGVYRADGCDVMVFEF